jgi:FecR protein
MKSTALFALAILLTLIFGTAAAQAAEPEELQPGVARVSLIHGDVVMQRGDSGDWIAGTLNTPVVAGDHVSAGAKSRTEVQLDYANILRLAENTEVKIADLTRTHAQVQVRLGLIDFTVFKGSEADVEIDTPNVAIRPLRQGQYRIEVRSEGSTDLIVRDGEAEVTTPQGSTTVKKGDMISVRGRENPEYQVSSAPRKDAWDDWNKERDHRIWDAESWRHTNRYYTGADDLDAYGRWVDVPGYDRVWQPVVVAGWAPYRYGRWVWEPYWGWTWVSYEPWGWAPYHYGRWFLHGSRWCWWPGPVFGRPFRPVWAPAFVSFFGFGRHVGVGVGFGFGSIGWLPIGPSDHFFPWWGRHGRSVNVVNVTNITNITNIRNFNGVAPLAGGNRPVRSNLHGVLDDPHMQRSLTHMPSGEFGRGPVPRNREIVDRAELRQAQMMAGTVPVVPTRDSLRVTDRQVATLPRHANQPERFFTKSEPRFRPEPFHAEAARVQESLGQRQDTPTSAKTGQMWGTETRANRPGATPALGQETPNTPTRNATETPAAANTRPEIRPENRGREVSNEHPEVRRETPESAHTPEARPAERNRVITNDSPESRRSIPATESSPARPEARAEERAPAHDWRRFGDAAQTSKPGSSGAPDRAAGDAQTQAQPPAHEQPRAQAAEQKEAPARTTAQPAPGTPGWRKFERQQNRESAPAQRTPEASRSTAPTRQQAAPERPAERPGFQRFERQPESRSAQPEVRSSEPASVSRPAAVQREQQRSAPRQVQREAPRAERPPLSVGRPIVTPRAAAPAREGGSRPARSGGENRGSSKPNPPHANQGSRNQK